MYNRKWYVVQKATDEETPNEIRNKRIKDTTVVKFMCDETYSAIPNTRIQPFGTTEIDEKRGKRDAKGYAIASTAKYGTDADKNNVQKENGKEDNESDETPDLVINDVCDKKEGETKTNDATSTEHLVQHHHETTITFPMILDTWSAIKDSNTDKIDTVMKLMITNDQKIVFGEDYCKLEEGNDVDKTSELYDLSPFMEDGIIKMQTRLTYSELLPEQMKHPIILGKGSRLAELVIMDAHVTQLHAGPEQTKRLVRNKYWVIGGKRAISKVINKCNHKECTSRRMKPVLQPPPPLPKERLGNDCFRYISIDASGPYDMKKCGVCNFSAICEKCDKKKSKEERKADEQKKNCPTKKVWISLFGCLITRNVNLELVQDKSAEQFLMSFQRHCSENGQPTWILSDRASEYIKTKDELEEIINSDAVKRYMENKGITWKQNPERSPKHNSTAESLIKVSKSALYGVFGNKKLTETEFTTAISWLRME